MADGWVDADSTIGVTTVLSRKQNARERELAGLFECYLHHLPIELSCVAWTLHNQFCIGGARKVRTREDGTWEEIEAQIRQRPEMTEEL